MNLKTYEKESSRTMSAKMHSSAAKVDTAHGIIGIAGEAGELLDAMKKAMFYGAVLDLDNVREEVGDIMWYIMAIVRSEGWDLETIMQENIDKLRVRYPNQWNKEHAELRLDKQDGGIGSG